MWQNWENQIRRAAAVGDKTETDRLLTAGWALVHQGELPVAARVAIERVEDEVKEIMNGVKAGL